MDLTLAQVLGALVTLVVAGIGYRQWLRGRRSVQYLAERERAYREVFAALEEAHLLIRNGGYTRETFDEGMRSANTLILKNGLYFAEQDKPVAQRYLAALNSAGKILTSERADATFAEFQAAMGNTADPIQLENLVPEYQTALRELDESRRAVVRAFERQVGKAYA
jgi:hypothetical protein